MHLQCCRPVEAVDAHHDSIKFLLNRSVCFLWLLLWPRVDRSDCCCCCCWQRVCSRHFCDFTWIFTSIFYLFVNSCHRRQLKFRMRSHKLCQMRAMHHLHWICFYVPVRGSDTVTVRVSISCYLNFMRECNNMMHQSMRHNCKFSLGFSYKYSIRIYMQYKRHHDIGSCNFMSAISNWFARRVAHTYLLVLKSKQ